MLTVLLIKVCFLQNLYMALVDLEGGAESDRQAGQNIVTLHQEKRLAIDFLMRRAKQCGEVDVGYSCERFKYRH